MNEPSNLYDEIPYPVSTYPQTHPNRLATLATLFGMTPAPVRSCRVLELGCGSGGNVIPMAAILPESLFVGIDLSASQIATGRALVAELGLRNIALDRMSILDVPADAGPFDYIIAHGVYGWVLPEVQDKILTICHENLAPQGVAYVSYNTYPGWHGRGAIRDMMQYHARRLTAPQARAAEGRALLAFLAGSVPGEHLAYSNLLKQEHQRVCDKTDGYLLHDELEEVNVPLYFHEFAARGAAHGLQYLAEADVRQMFVRRFPPTVMAILERLGGDLIEREQYRDFLTNCTYRQTLLCHRNVALTRAISPERLTGLFIAACGQWVGGGPDLSSDRAEEFRGPEGSAVAASQPLFKAALLSLADVWPQAVPFSALETMARDRLAGGAVVVENAEGCARDRRLLADNLWQAFVAGVVELHADAPPLVLEPGEHPTAPPLARLQAAGGTRVTNLRHETVPLDDLTCYLLRHLNGQQDRRALLDVLVRRVEEHGLVVQQHGRPVTDAGQLRAVLGEGLQAKLGALGRSGLLFA
ncbi:MAG TPA: class I SAM-dependent methyltransferase [Gemmataceae bacterium]|nr:class I SAM-dependent methyltransferase [Gemmataceae bacterium]